MNYSMYESEELIKKLHENDLNIGYYTYIDDIIDIYKENGIKSLKDILKCK